MGVRSYVWVYVDALGWCVLGGCLCVRVCRCGCGWVDVCMSGVCV